MDAVTMDETMLDSYSITKCDLQQFISFGGHQRQTRSQQSRSTRNTRHLSLQLGGTYITDLCLQWDLICRRCVQDRTCFNERFTLHIKLLMSCTTAHHTNCSPERQDACNTNYFNLRYFEGSENCFFIQCLLVNIDI